MNDLIMNVKNSVHHQLTYTDNLSV